MRSWFSIFHVSFMPHGDSFVVQLLCPAAVVSLHDALTHAHARTRTHTHAQERTRTHAGACASAGPAVRKSEG